jgi:hypothetical protein
VTLALKIAGAVVVVLLIGVGALRVRKLRRDEMRELSKPLDRRLVKPPPSPYATSKGFRLLDDSGAPLARPPVERPHLDPERHYVFSDSASNAEDLAALRVRHNDDWFLSRSSHRSTISIVSRRVAVAALIILVIVVIVTYYVSHNSTPTPKGSASHPTTTLANKTGATTTTTVVFPSSFVALSTSGDDATYSVPATRYRVVVTGSLGPTWAVYNMGPTNTLEWQGTVAQGQDKLLVMTGNSRITIGSPSNGTVSVDGRPVVFPTPLPSTLILVFSPASPPTTK